MRLSYLLLFNLIGCTIQPMTDDEWLDSITLPNTESVMVSTHRPIIKTSEPIVEAKAQPRHKHSTSWMDFVDLGSDNSPVYLVSGALSQHINTEKAFDQNNSLIAIEKGSVQAGIFDNSRVRPSKSLYVTSKWYKRKIKDLNTEFNSKIGATFYDGNSGYKAKLRPIITLGIRQPIPQNPWLDFVDLDYAPGNLIGGTGVVYLTIGKILKPLKD